MKINCCQDGKKHDIEVRKTKMIEGPPKVVFSALTEPEKLAEWFQDDADLDVRVGGRIRLVTLKDKHPEWNLDRDYYMEELLWNLFLIKDFLIVGNLKLCTKFS